MSISNIHINTMISCAIQSYEKNDSQFLEAAIEHLAQYDLTQDQNDKIQAILNNIPSPNIEEAASLMRGNIIQVLEGKPVFKTTGLPSDFWQLCFNLCPDVKDCNALSVVNKGINRVFKKYLEFKFPQIVRLVPMIDTGLGELPNFCQLKAIKLVEKVDPETLENFSMVIMRKGLSFKKSEQIKNGRDILISEYQKENILQAVTTEFVKETYPVLISNNPLKGSIEFTSDEKRLEFLMKEGYELPTFLELFTFYSFKNQCLREFAPACASTNLGSNGISIQLMKQFSFNPNQTVSPEIIHISSYPKSYFDFELCMHGKFK